jgi:hypothetical protein
MLAAAALLLGLPAQASAGSLRFEESKSGETTLLYTAAPREANDVSVQAESASSIVVADAGAPIKATRACEALDRDRFRCSAKRFEAIALRLGDGADRARVDPGEGDLIAVSVTGGIDADDLEVDGGGSAALFGGGGSDRIVGGSGDDVLGGGVGTEPDVIEGGAGRDLVTYAGHRHEVDVDLAGGSGGAEGEHDAISGVEGAVGSRFDDSLAGDEGDNALLGAAGDDGLIGGAGDDALDGGGGSDQLLGGDGDDVIASAEAPARNRADVIGCGPGADLAHTAGKHRGSASPRDLITTDCETVTPGLLNRPVGVPPRPLDNGRVVLGLPCPVTAAAPCVGKLTATANGEVLARGRGRLGRRTVTPVKARLTAAGRRVERQGGALPVRFRVEVGFTRSGSGRTVHARATILLLVPVS